MAPRTACFLVIGNEILSGRTQDANIRVLAQALNGRGIRLLEVRVIPDIPEHIITTINDCRARFDLLFTSGGIGPTHDDITAACVAEAFGVPLTCHEESFHQLKALFPAGEFNKARQRMAWLPKGATPIENSVSTAPGFSLGNVHVMAGVPRIFQAMVGWLMPRLEGGAPLTSASWYSYNVYEGDLAEALTAIQHDFPTLDIGSYPFDEGQKRGVALVAKGYDAEAVTLAGAALRTLLASLGFTPLEGDPPRGA
ncbi:competence/damage-inducible protein A [Bombella sp. ESL0380]|uniref:competence/damage-inducible protein A n=1 Tax=Bombella sp. ESL0380 TaxID=2676444 RepID=UPI00139BF22A|nr:competence/damage-inducible protein A [Bombella sp. ESL0380]